MNDLRLSMKVEIDVERAEMVVTIYAPPDNLEDATTETRFTAEAAESFWNLIGAWVQSADAMGAIVSERRIS